MMVSWFVLSKKIVTSDANLGGFPDRNIPISDAVTALAIMLFVIGGGAESIINPFTRLVKAVFEVAGVGHRNSLL